MKTFIRTFQSTFLHFAVGRKCCEYFMELLMEVHGSKVTDRLNINLANLNPSYSVTFSYEWWDKCNTTSIRSKLIIFQLCCSKKLFQILKAEHFCEVVLGPEAQRRLDPGALQGRIPGSLHGFCSKSAPVNFTELMILLTNLINHGLSCWASFIISRHRFVT